MGWQTALRLGRVSNLPTVWTNVMTGAVLAGGSLDDRRIWVLLPALSLFYVGGMYLNDAFDADRDVKERPERPIPSDVARRSTVYVSGFALLALGIACLIGLGYLMAGSTGGWPALAGLTLALTIVIYNWHHKDNPLSPMIMAVCRMLVYVIAGLAFIVPPPALLLGAALLLLGYLIGLTYLAKQETLTEIEHFWPLACTLPSVLLGIWAMVEGGLTGFCAFALFVGCLGAALLLLRRRHSGDIGHAVLLLIAGIALLDALILAGAGASGLAWCAMGAFLLTLMLQQFVPGT